MAHHVSAVAGCERAATTHDGEDCFIGFLCGVGIICDVGLDFPFSSSHVFPVSRFDVGIGVVGGMDWRD